MYFIFLKKTARNILFKKVPEKLARDFLHDISYRNTERIIAVTPFLLILNIIITGLPELFDILSTPTHSSIAKYKALVNISLNVFFFIVILGSLAPGILNKVDRILGFRFLIIFSIIVLSHLMALALLHSQSNVAIYFFLLPLCALMVGFYWRTPDIIILALVSNVIFFILLFLFQDNSFTAFEMLNLSIFYTLVFFLISRASYSLKIQEFENIRKSQFQTKLLKEQNRKIENARKDLIFKNHELDTFVYRASHDLRGPVASILGLHDVVAMEVKEQRALEYFNIFNNQAKRLNEIILSLIEITKIKDSEIQFARIDFSQLIKFCYDRFSHLNAFRECKFWVEIDIDEPFYSDVNLLRIILMNLMDNSLKYRRENVDSYIRIYVYTNKLKDNLIIQFSDNGLGIPRNIHDKIFNMFFRGTEVSKGSGLGLYTLKIAVEKLKGDISFNSMENEGSTFNIILPVTKLRSQHNKSFIKSTNIEST